MNVYEKRARARDLDAPLTPLSQCPHARGAARPAQDPHQHPGRYSSKEADAPGHHHGRQRSRLRALEHPRLGEDWKGAGLFGLGHESGESTRATGDQENRRS